MHDLGWAGVVAHTGGEQLVFETHRIKMGKTLAYVDTQIFDSKGSLLASARFFPCLSLLYLFKAIALKRQKMSADTRKKNSTHRVSADIFAISA